MPIKQSKFYWKLVWRLLVRVSIWEWYSIWFQLRAVLISEDFIFLSNMWNNPYKPLRILSKNSIFKCFFDDFIQTSMKVARMCPSLSIEWLVLAKYSWIIWRHLRFWYGEQRFLQENCMPSYLSRCFTGSPLKKKVLSYIYIPNLYITNYTTRTICFSVSTSQARGNSKLHTDSMHGCVLLVMTCYQIKQSVPVCAHSKAWYIFEQEFITRDFI